MFMNCVKAFLLVLILLASTSIAGEQIVWLTDDKNDIEFFKKDQPYTIGLDSLKLVLETANMNVEKLNIASVARMNTQLLQTTNTCVASRLKTDDRIGKYLFSLPFNIHPMPRFYYHEENIQIPATALDEEGNIHSLAEIFLSNPENQLSIVEGVSFEQEIDKMIAAIPEENKHIFSVDNRYQVKIQLLLEGFVDVIIAYPMDFPNEGIVLEEHPYLLYLPFATAQPYMISYIACSKSELGIQTINKINSALKLLYQQQKYLDAHLNHLPKSEHQSFKHHYNSVFNSQNQR